MPENQFDEVMRLFGGRSARTASLNDPSQAAQGIVGFFGTSECSGHVGVEHHHDAARGVAGSIFIGPRLTEIVLGKYLVDGGPVGRWLLS